MPLITTHETVRIELPTPGEWVDVKRVLTRGDEVEVQRRLVAGTRVRPDDPKADLVLDAGDAIERAQFALMEVAIVAWSFEEPVTPENIRLLDAASARFIEARLNELYEGRSEDEKNA